MTEKQLQRSGRTMLEAIQRGMKANLVRPSETVRPSNAIVNRLQRLKSWRKHKAEELKVESDIILPRTYMHAIAEKNPRSLEALAHLMDEAPWRLEHFGPEIIKTLGVKEEVV